MSIWTSNSGRSVALCLTLAGCVAGLTEPATSSSRSLSVLGGDVRVQAPAGYCVDQGASRETGQQAVVIIGRCSARAATLAAVVTVSVGAPGTASALALGTPALASYFASEPGRAALSRDGDAASVTLRDIRAAEGRLILHLDDASTGETWRALIGLRGRLVSISVTGASQDQPAGPQGRRLLESTISAMTRGNPVLR